MIIICRYTTCPKVNRKIPDSLTKISMTTNPSLRCSKSWRLWTRTPGSISKSNGPCNWKTTPTNCTIQRTSTCTWTPSWRWSYGTAERGGSSSLASIQTFAKWYDWSRISTLWCSLPLERVRFMINTATRGVGPSSRLLNMLWW